MRAQRTVCVSATLCPTRRSVSQRSMSVERPGIAIGAEALLQGGIRRRGAQARVAVQMRSTDTRLHRSLRGCSSPRGTTGRSCRSPYRVGHARRARAATALRRVPSPPPSAAGSSAPPRRTSGVVSLSGALFARQPWSPFGPNRPRFTRSPARPRTPTMRPSCTAMSRPQPFEQRTHADGTHDTCFSSTSGSSSVSTRTVHSSPGANGVRAPQISAIRPSTVRVRTAYGYLVLRKPKPVSRGRPTSFLTSVSAAH